MKRHLLIIAIFLVLGAVVNVAVAWGIDSWNEQQPSHILLQRVHGRILPPSFHQPHPRYAVGFPANAMGYTWTFDHVFQHRLRPLWPGFAINTAFYATLLWLLIPGRFALRRFLRLKRGLCLKCAYPMGESAVCTECGCGLLKRASTT